MQNRRFKGMCYIRMDTVGIRLCIKNLYNTQGIRSYTK